MAKYYRKLKPIAKELPFPEKPTDAFRRHFTVAGCSDMPLIVSRGDKTFNLGTPNGRKAFNYDVKKRRK